MVQVTILYYKMLTCITCPGKSDGGTHRKALPPNGGTHQRALPPNGGTHRKAALTEKGAPIAKGAAGAAPFWRNESVYLMPVVAMPLMRNRWPNRNTRNTGSRDTMDIAKSDPQLVADCESTKARRATGTVNISGSVR